MPVRLNTHHLQEPSEARIEIVPLIDIMFFLLASFMLVSLSMVNMKSVKVNLPTATTASGDTSAGSGTVDVSVDSVGRLYLDKQKLSDAALVGKLIGAVKANPKLRVFISGDRDARHGDVIHALDLVREAGIDKVAFEIGNGPGKPTTP